MTKAIIKTSPSSILLGSLVFINDFSYCLTSKLESYSGLSEKADGLFQVIGINTPFPTGRSTLFHFARPINNLKLKNISTGEIVFSCSEYVSSIIHPGDTIIINNNHVSYQEFQYLLYKGGYEINTNLYKFE